jgi:hypothetical protein
MLGITEPIYTHFNKPKMRNVMRHLPLCVSKYQFAISELITWSCALLGRPPFVRILKTFPSLYRP